MEHDPKFNFYPDAGDSEVTVHFRESAHVLSLRNLGQGSGWCVGFRGRVRVRRVAHNQDPRPRPLPTCPTRLLGPLQTHLPVFVSLIYEPLHVRQHVPRGGLQLLPGHVWNLQNLQVQHVLLVLGHLRAHMGRCCSGWAGSSCEGPRAPTSQGQP